MYRKEREYTVEYGVKENISRSGHHVSSNKDQDGSTLSIMKDLIFQKRRKRGKKCGVCVYIYIYIWGNKDKIKMRKPKIIHLVRVVKFKNSQINGKCTLHG